MNTNGQVSGDAQAGNGGAAPHPAPGPAASMTQEHALVVDNAAAGAYRRLVLQAPVIAERARPGHFVACATGPRNGSGSLLLRRAFSLHRADPATGTIELVVADHAPGTHWICTRAPGELLDLLGPGGRGFALPQDDSACVLVGGGYGSAPLFWLADELRARGNRADLVLGAANTPRLFGHDLHQRAPHAAGEAGPGSGMTYLVTEDGSLGSRGRVSDVLGEVIAAAQARLVYACGPMAMLRAVHQLAHPLGVPTQLAVEESMACGIGVCMTCVLPVVGADGQTRMARSCVDGPVLSGASLRWDAIDIAAGRATSRVPSDCLGAPLPPAHSPNDRKAADTAVTEPGENR